MSQGKWKQNAPRIILAFIATLAIVSTVLLITLKATIFNQEYMITQSQTSGYVAEITKDINDYIQDNARASNIPPEVVKDSVKEDLVQQNVSSFIRAIYTDVPYRLVGTDAIRNNLNQSIETYAKEKKLDITDKETKSNIQHFVDESVTVFERYVAIPTFRTFAKQLISYNKQFVMIIILSGIFSLLLLIGLVLVSGRYLHRRLRYLAYTFAGSGLMLIVLPTILYKSNQIDHLAIHSKALYSFITIYLKNALLLVIHLGIGCVVVGVLAMIMSEILRRRVSR